MTKVGVRSLRIGQELDGRFRIDAHLGGGGQGQVYVATQLGLDRQVAIKTLNPELAEHPHLVQRFHREAQIIQSLAHPNTVRIYDFGQTDDDLMYIVMEYLKGRPLDLVVRRSGSLPVDDVTGMGCQILGALMEAHSMGMVHRDIKPSNMFLCELVGAPNFVKLLDFGLARGHIGGKEAFKTATGAVMGTPHYMSPEQVRGEVVDARTDLYSLAFSLYELATGDPPYHGETPYQVIAKHLTEEPISLPNLLMDCRLGRVIAKAAQKNMEERYGTAEEMLRDLSGMTATRSGPRDAKPDEHGDRLTDSFIPETLPTGLAGPSPSEADSTVSEPVEPPSTSDSAEIRVPRSRAPLAVLVILVGALICALALALSRGSDDSEGDTPEELRAVEEPVTTAPAPTEVPEPVPTDDDAEAGEGTGSAVVAVDPALEPPEPDPAAEMEAAVTDSSTEEDRESPPVGGEVPAEEIEDVEVPVARRERSRRHRVAEEPAPVESPPDTEIVTVPLVETTQQPAETEPPAEESSTVRDTLQGF